MYIYVYVCMHGCMRLCFLCKQNNLFSAIVRATTIAIIIPSFKSWVFKFSALNPQPSIDHNPLATVRCRFHGRLGYQSSEPEPAWGFGV